MAELTLRSTKGSALTYAEMDGNFEYFTGSYMTASHVPGVLTFDAITSSITGSGQISYSPSGGFHIGEYYFGHY
jgi:hypothetical protein